MRTVNEVSQLTGVSIRTLRYYDEIGLLHPTEHTEAGYRLYDDAALETLQQILLFRELQFPLSEIRRIMDSPDYDKQKALKQQIELLTLKKEHLENLIGFARGLALMGVKHMKKIDFSAFDTKKIDEYTEQAKKTWGETDAYKEYEQKSKGRTKAQEQALGDELMQYFVALGGLRGKDPADEEVQQQIAGIQSFITEHMYTCTKPILRGLGAMYAAGGDFTANIDAVGGEGTAEFAAAAIEIYCQE